MVLRARFTPERVPFSRLAQQRRKSTVWRHPCYCWVWGAAGKIGGSGLHPRKGVIAPGKRDRRVTGLALQQFSGGRG